jgi:hypothetical protein
MQLLPVLLVASAVSALRIPPQSRHQKAQRQASVLSASATVSGAPTSTPLFSDTAPTATYLPTVHWDTNTSGNQSLAPKNSHTFYYAQDGVNGTCFLLLIVFNSVDLLTFRQLQILLKTLG